MHLSKHLIEHAHCSLHFRCKFATRFEEFIPAAQKEKLHDATAKRVGMVEACKGGSADPIHPTRVYSDVAYAFGEASLELAVLFVVGACVLEQPTSTNNDRINEGKNIFLIINFMFTFNDFTK